MGRYYSPAVGMVVARKSFVSAPQRPTRYVFEVGVLARRHKNETEVGAQALGRRGSWSDGESPIDVFVAEMAAELGLTQSPSDCRTRRLLIRLFEWSAAEGLPLDREIVLDPDTVERFSDIGLAGESSRATYRSVLRRVGPLLTKKAPWVPRPSALARRQVAPHYSAHEVETLKTDARLQPTESRCRAARAFIALGLGVGLDGRGASKVQACDLKRAGSALFVHTGEPQAREIVCVAEWEAQLADLAATAGDEFLIGGRSTSSKRTGNLIDSLHVPTGHPKVAPARLRSTWLVGHINAGTRLPELREAAGLKGCHGHLGPPRFRGATRSRSHGDASPV